MCLNERLAPVFPEAAFHLRSHKLIRLGPVRLEIRSNEPSFKGFRFFSAGSCQEETPASDAAPHFSLTLCNLKVDAPWPLPTLSAMRDQSYRAKRMSAGYYLTDHFGAPAYLMTRGAHYWIFAEDFEPILWPYAIKHLLSVYAIEHEMLHLKAAGIAMEGQGTLLVGRGGSGKTVLLNHLCRAGARFLSNTHALIEGHALLGIATAMRVRRDQFFAPVIATRGLSPSVKAGEYVVDPLSDLGWHHVASAPVRSICLLDYKGVDRTVIREIDRDTMFDYMEQFTLALNVYGLKEDILDALGGDIGRFSTVITQMRDQLRSLVGASRCYYLSCDTSDERNLEAISGLLCA